MRKRMRFGDLRMMAASGLSRVLSILHVQEKSATTGVPVNTVAPTIAGDTPVGSTLTFTTGTWTLSPSKTRQWTRDGVAIPGETATTYVTVSDDIGASVACVEVGTLAPFHGYGISNAIVITSIALPVNTVAGVATTSHTAPGSTITMTTGTWTGTGISYTYQMTRNGVDSGAPQASQYYVIDAGGADNGVAIRFKPVATNGAGTVVGTASNAITPAAATYSSLNNDGGEGDYSLSESDRRILYPASPGGTIATSIHTHAAGSYYIEALINQGLALTGHPSLGVGKDAAIGAQPSGPVKAIVGTTMYIGDGKRYSNGLTAGADVATATDADVIGITVDIDNNAFKVRKNNTLLYTGTLAAGSSGAWHFFMNNEGGLTTDDVTFKVAPSDLVYPATATADHATPGWPQA